MAGWESLALPIAWSLLLPWAAVAGPPFFTDDPEPVELHHSEFYVFSTYDKSGDGHLPRGVAAGPTRPKRPSIDSH